MGVPHHHVSVPTFISLHFFSEHPQNMFCCIAFFLFTFSSSEIWRLFRLRRQPKKKKNIFPIGRCSTLSPSHVIPPSTPHRIRAKTENRRRRRLRRRRRQRRIDKTFDDGGICATRTPAAAAPTNTRQSRFSVQIFLHNLQNNRRRVQQNSTPARRMFQDDTNPPELLQLLEIQKKKLKFSLKQKPLPTPRKMFPREIRNR